MAIYHKLNLALCGMVPAALVLSPSMINFPIDLAMGFAIPVHFLIGGHGVVTDYAQKIIKAKWFENGLRVGLLGLTAVTVVGLLKLNLQGPGLTEAVKDLWRPPPEGKPVRKYLPGFLYPNKE